MFRSIRWSLQLWHAGILGLALASFGTALYIGISRAQFSRVDAELEGAARVFVNATMTPGALGPDFGRGPRGGGGGRGFGGRGGPGGQGGGPLENAAPGGAGGAGLDGGRGPGDGSGGPGPGGGRGPGGFGGGGAGGGGPGFGPGGFGGGAGGGGPGNGPGGGGGGGGPWVGSPEWWAAVPEDSLRHIGENEQDQPYFVVFGMGGAVLRSSSNAADIVVPVPDMTPPPQGTNFATAQPDFRTRGNLREVMLQGPFGVHVLVGKSLASVHASLLFLRWELFAAGAAVMAVGLCGGWLLSLRATRPIRAISQTARAISASDLSRRITVDQTDSELGSLAATLNDTFDRLQVAFDRQVRFTADASHELRTPLSVIHSQTELSLSRERSAPEYKQSLEVCLRAAKRMKSLVESLLVLARADAGKLVLNVEHFDLAAAAEECAAMVAPRAAERRVTIDLHAQPVEIDADRTKIMQLITNLLANAIQYNQEGGRVTLTIAPGGSSEGGKSTGSSGAATEGTAGTSADEVLIRVADTGVGISPEDQARVFERFFRADKARSRDLGGSGLGLAICRSIAEAHHGAITFTSQLGEGTTFIVRLPLKRP